MHECDLKDGGGSCCLFRRSLSHCSGKGPSTGGKGYCANPSPQATFIPPSRGDRGGPPPKGYPPYQPLAPGVLMAQPPPAPLSKGQATRL